MHGQTRTYRYESKGVEDTRRLARELASRVVPGTVLALDGELGAGKTTFSQEVAKALGVEGVVNSPTFTIVKEYEGRSLPFYHMDVYRLSPEDAEDMGLDEYWFGDGVSLVEWASKVTELLPEERLDLYIELGSEPDRRTIYLTPHGELYEDWCTILKESGLVDEQA